MRKSIEKLESVNPVSFVVDALIRNWIKTNNFKSWYYNK
jgi:hypothetical protein